MKFMIAWTITPDAHRAAGEAFLESGAPAPDGMEILGRWHAPGSQRGWALLEGNEVSGLARHAAEWGSLLEIQVTPVLDDADAAEALGHVYGK